MMPTKVESDWPEHHEELGRKTMTVLHQWTERYEAGKITLREYYILVSGLYDATSGLMDREFSELLANIHRDLRRTANPTAARKAA